MNDIELKLVQCNVCFFVYVEPKLRNLHGDQGTGWMPEEYLFDSS